MSIILPGLGKPMADEGQNNKTQEYWTTIKGRKIYARSLEALYRTVAYGWIEDKGKSICLYCGKEWYVLSEPCSCLISKGDMGKRLMAMKKLNEIVCGQKEQDKREKAKNKAQEKKKPSDIILPNG